MTDIVIAEAVRSAVGRGSQGLARAQASRRARRRRHPRPARARAAGRSGKIDDVVLGCAMPEGEQGLNVARVDRAARGPRPEVPGADHQPLLLERPAGDRDRRRLDRDRLERHRASPAASSR